jgi:lysozyme family protein
MSIETFNKAFDISMGHEGLYSNDPDDIGKETYRGISRNFHPTWSGWEIIDKNKNNLKQVFNILDKQTRNFYLREFWLKCNCDNLNPDIAIELFDSSINCEWITACKWLQQSINFLNKNQQIYKDIKVDGFIGSETLNSLKSCLQHYGEDYVKLILKIMNILQGYHYLELMRKFPVNEKYIGWFKRVSL